MDREAWCAVVGPGGCKESETTSWLNNERQLSVEKLPGHKFTPCLLQSKISKKNFAVAIIFMGQEPTFLGTVSAFYPTEYDLMQQNCFYI